VPGVPSGIERVVLRAMEKNPAARFQDAQSLGRALLPFASERIVLTYRAELEGAAESFEPAYEHTAAVNTTLSSAVRSVATEAPVTWRVLPWAASLAALALVGAMLAFWPRATEQQETTVSPAQQPNASPPTAAPPEPPVRPIEARPTVPVAEEALPPELPPTSKEPTHPGATKPKRPRAKPLPQDPTLPAPEPKQTDDIWGNRK